MRKLLKKQGFAPDVLVTDKLRSYGAAKSEIGLSARHDAAVQNTFNVQRHLTSRRTLRVLREEAFQTWRAATAA